MLHRVYCAAALVTLASPGAASAQETGRFRFEWVREEGAESCPDAPALAREVARRLGRDPFALADAPSIEAVVRRESNRWRARIVVRDAADARIGVREFTSDADDCAAIASAVTLGVALSIDPEAALRPIAPPAPPPAAPVTPVTPPPTRAPPANTELLSRAVVSLSATLSGGLLPSAAGVTPGVALRAEGPIAWRMRWSAGMTYLPESSVTLALATVAFGLTAGWLAPCVEFRPARRVSLVGCVPVYVGALHAVVREGAPSQTGDFVWAAVAAGLRARWRFAGPFAAELGGEVVAPLVRHRFFAGSNPRETVFQQSAIGASGYLGLAFQFR